MSRFAVAGVLAMSLATAQTRIDLQAQSKGVDFTGQPWTKPIRALTQKTNQFNLTTRRYTEADLRQAWENGAAIFMASLRDRFGDYGRILLAIVKRQARGIAELDTFLMSCRVIGRGVEDACLRLAMQYVRGEYGVLIAEYLRTPRNGLCADFLDRNGFTVVSNDSRGVVYSYDLSRGIADIPQHFAVDRGSVAVAR